MPASALGQALGRPSLMLRVRDLRESVDWFHRTLGVQPFASGVDGEHPYAAFSFGGTGVALWQLQPDDPDPETNLSSTYLVFTVSSGIDEIRETLVSRGARAGKLRTSAVARFFWFYDPDGHRFEVSQPIGSPAA